METNPISANQVNNIYYKWWVAMVKRAPGTDKARMRRALSVIEGMRSEYIYKLVDRRFNIDRRNPQWCKALWAKRMADAIYRRASRDAEAVIAMMEHAPELLLSIAGIINGARRSTCPRATLRCIILLDVINRDNIYELRTEVLKSVPFIVDKRSVYMPLREPDVHAVTRKLTEVISGTTLVKAIDNKMAKNSKHYGSVLKISVA
jgi:hypothetical protein